MNGETELYRSLFSFCFFFTREKEIRIGCNDSRHDSGISIYFEIHLQCPIQLCLVVGALLVEMEEDPNMSCPSDEGPTFQNLG